MPETNVNGYSSQAEAHAVVDPAKIDFQVEVLRFDHSTKPGSRFAGNANVSIKGLIAGSDIEVRLGYFAPFDVADPEEHGRCKFANYKDDATDTWKPQVRFTDTNLHYRVLGKARKAIELYLNEHVSPTKAFDEIPQNIPIDDGDIPF